MITAGDFIRVKVFFKMPPGSTGMNRFDFKVAGSGEVSSSDLLDALEGAFSAAYGQLKNYISEDVEYDQMVVNKLWYNDIEHKWVEIEEVGRRPITAPGLSTYERVPNTITANIQLGTGHRRRRGRKAIGGLCDNGVDGNELQTGLMVALAAFVEDLLSSIPVSPSIQLVWGILSRSGLFYAITYYVIHKLVGSQDTRDARRTP